MYEHSKHAIYSTVGCYGNLDRMDPDKPMSAFEFADDAPIQAYFQVTKSQTCCQLRIDLEILASPFFSKGV